MAKVTNIGRIDELKDKDWFVCAIWTGWLCTAELTVRSIVIGNEEGVSRL